MAALEYRLRVRRRDGLRVALEWYLQHATWNDQGRYSIKGGGHVTDAVHHVLVAAVEADGDVPDVIRQRIVVDALARWYVTSKDPRDVGAFDRALADAAESLRQCARPYRVLTLWNVQLPTPLTFTVAGVETTLEPWAEAQHLPLHDIWDRARNFWLGSAMPGWMYEHDDKWWPRSGLVPAISKVATYDWFAAVEIASGALELIRGALNRPRAQGAWLRWTRYPTPLGEIHPSPIYAVCREDGTVEDVAYGMEGIHDWRAIAVTQEEVARCSSLLAEISDQPDDGGLPRFKRQIIRLYEAAMEESDKKSQFMGFWQVLEAATLSEPGSKDQVESRLITLLALEHDSLITHLGRALADTRHDLVHRGVFAVNDGQLPITMKWIADHALDRVFHLVDELGGLQELREYFQHATRGDRDLNRLVNVATHILNGRKTAIHPT